MAWVNDAMVWLAAQPGKTGGEKNIKACRKAWTDLSNGTGIFSNSRPNDGFCVGIRIDPSTHDVHDLHRKNQQWIDPNAPGKDGPIPGRYYDRERGWKLNTQLKLLRTYVGEKEREGVLIRRNPLLVIERPFKGTPNPEINHSRRSACQSEAGDSLRLLGPDGEDSGSGDAYVVHSISGGSDDSDDSDDQSQLVEEPVRALTLDPNSELRELNEEREAWKREYKDARAKFKEEHQAKKNSCYATFEAIEAQLDEKRRAAKEKLDEEHRVAKEKFDAELRVAKEKFDAELRVAKEKFDAELRAVNDELCENVNELKRKQADVFLGLDRKFQEIKQRKRERDTEFDAGAARFHDGADSEDSEDSEGDGE